jgi:hypothetical protein
MWARVDDGWWCHRKVMALSLAARGLWISALSWSCAQRDDVVPLSFVLKEANGKQDEANELANAGLWIACNEGWRIHQWSDYQDKSLSEKRAEAGRKGGQASRSTKQTPSKTEANGQAGPSLPVPTRNDSSQDYLQPVPFPAAERFLSATLGTGA